MMKVCKKHRCCYDDAHVCPACFWEDAYRAIAKPETTTEPPKLRMLDVWKHKGSEDRYVCVTSGNSLALFVRGVGHNRCYEVAEMTDRIAKGEFEFVGNFDDLLAERKGGE